MQGSWLSWGLNAFLPQFYESVTCLTLKLRAVPPFMVSRSRALAVTPEPM